jgi:hypothetical protein
MYSRSFCHPDSSVFDARVPPFSSLGRRTGGQLRRSLGLYQLITTRPIIFLLLLYSRYSYFLHYCVRLTLPSVRSLQGPLLHSSTTFFSTLPFRQLISLWGRFRRRPNGTHRRPLLASPSTKEGREWSITNVTFTFYYLLFVDMFRFY